VSYIESNGLDDPRRSSSKCGWIFGLRQPLRTHDGIPRILKEVRFRDARIAEAYIYIENRICQPPKKKYKSVGELTQAHPKRKTRTKIQ
jgi:hypothetical protein